MSLIQEWEAAIADERTARAEVAALRDAGATKAKQRDVSRQWYLKVAHILRLNVRHSSALPPLPGEFVERLARMMADIGNGVIPLSISEAGRKGGGIGAGYLERRDKAIAAAYLARVKSGEFSDKHPSQTVGILLGFGELSEGSETAGTTQKDAEQNARRQAARRLLAKADDYREEFSEFWEHSADKLSKLIEQAGERHRQAGRTHGAISSRG